MKTLRYAILILSLCRPGFTKIYAQMSWQDARLAYSRLINDSTKFDSAFHMAMLANETAHQEFAPISKEVFYSENSLAFAYKACGDTLMADSIWVKTFGTLQHVTDTTFNEIKKRLTSNLIGDNFHYGRIFSIDTALLIAQMDLAANLAIYDTTSTSLNRVAFVAYNIEKYYGKMHADGLYATAALIRGKVYGSHDLLFTKRVDSLISSDAHYMPDIRRILYQTNAADYTQRQLDTLISETPKDNNFWNQLVYIIALKDKHAKLNLKDTSCEYTYALEWLGLILENAFYCHNAAVCSQQAAIDAYKEREAAASPDIARAYYNLGRIYAHAAQHVDAIGAYNIAAANFKLRKDDEYIRVLINLAISHGALLDDKSVQKGEALLWQAAAIVRHKHGTGSLEYGRTVAVIAGFDTRNARFDKAMRVMDTCIRIFESFGKNAVGDLDEIYRQYGFVYACQEDLAKALYWNQRSWALTRLASDSISDVERFRQCVTLWSFYEGIGDIRKSDLELDSIGKIVSRISEWSRLTYYWARANQYARLGRYAAADSMYLNNISLVYSHGYDLVNDDVQNVINRSWDGLVNSYMKQNKFDSAAQITTRQIMDNKSRNMNLVGVNGPYYYILSDCAIQNHDFRKAQLLADTALLCIKSTYASNSIILIENRFIWADKYFAAGRVDTALSEMANALTMLAYAVTKNMQGLSESQMYKYITTLTNDLQKYYNYFTTSYPQHSNESIRTYNLVLQAKGLLLNTLNRVNRNLASGASQDLRLKLTRLKELKHTLANTYNYTIAQLQAAHLSTDSLQQASDQLERELSRQSPAFGQATQQTADFYKVRAALKTDEAAVEFVAYKKFDPAAQRFSDTTLYAAYVVRHNMPYPTYLPLAIESELVPLIANQSVGGRGIPAAAGNVSPGRHFSMLYKKLWKPLTPELNGIRTLYIANDGLTSKVAFNALQDTTGQYLSDMYELHFLLSTKDVAQRSVSAWHPGTATLFGGAYFDSKVQAGDTVLLASRSLPADLRGGTGFTYLPGTKAEVDHIYTILQPQIRHVECYSGIEASEAAFKKMDGKSPALIHIATHGFYFPLAQQMRINTENGSDLIRYSLNENPLLRSGLAFAGANAAWEGAEVKSSEDGILTAYELANMDLGKTQLVVLSACETGIGEIQNGEGVFGMQRALRQAGVQQMIVSLWPVPDKETAEIMQLFYKDLAEGRPPAVALRNAQRTMKKNTLIHPAAWAGFELIE